MLKEALVDVVWFKEVEWLYLGEGICLDSITYCDSPLVSKAMKIVCFHPSSTP